MEWVIFTSEVNSNSNLTIVPENLYQYFAVVLLESTIIHHCVQKVKLSRRFSPSSSDNAISNPTY
jgi:hypothetical protein